MYLQRIHLTQFKSHQNSQFEFQKGINIISGPNGAGKTNILDAIYYLSVFKSFQNHNDAQLINHGCDFFRIEAEFDQEYKVIAKHDGRRKVIEINELRLKKHSEFFGHIPLIFSSPADSELILGGSEERRKLIDYTISMVDKQYLLKLNQYQDHLDQRNAHLKSTARPDEELIKIYDQKLVDLGYFIYEQRKAFHSKFLRSIEAWYAKIRSEDRLEEPFSFEYKSQLHDQAFDQLLRSSFQKDCILQRTTKGVHRDDIVFTQMEREAKKIASQGQIKTLLYATRLAQADWIAEETGRKVIFLMDDFSDKLDQQRKANLLSLMQEISFVDQWILTDTNRYDGDVHQLKID